MNIRDGTRARARSMTGNEEARRDDLVAAPGDAGILAVHDLHAGLLLDLRGALDDTQRGLDALRGVLP